MQDEKKKAFLVNPNIVFKDIEDERILFNPATGYIQVINEIGRFIYENCDGKFSKDEVVEMVIKNYEGASKEKITNEVDSFLEEMLRMNWIKPA